MSNVQTCCQAIFCVLKTADASLQHQTPHHIQLCISHVSMIDYTLGACLDAPPYSLIVQRTGQLY